MMKRYLTNFTKDNLIGEYDVVIIGSGAAGLYTALMLDRSFKVLVMTKSEITKSNSYLAQGGIAASMTEEQAISHIEDTIVAGCSHNDLEAVKRMIFESRENIDELIRLNVPFDRNKDGTIHMTKEGGHSVSRILHVLDKTGEGIVDTLIYHAEKRENIHIYENTYAVDVITTKSADSKNGKKACGVLMIKDGKVSVVKAGAVVIASGGIGKLYEKTTNSDNSTGDGIGIASRCGVEFRDMEFVQFHPTAHVHDNGDGTTSTLLISEAVRGEGARLVNSEGVYFMEGIHEMKDLAPRNIVAEEIFNQIHDGKSVYLDLSDLDPDYVKKRFPNIYLKMKKLGVDITTDLVRVTPVQHYFMGGIKVDLDGSTNIDMLYACGETSNTGIHGANRLASNSLLEAIVYGRRVAAHILKNKDKIRSQAESIQEEFENGSGKCEITDEFAKITKDKIRSIMTGYVSIIREPDDMEKAKLLIDHILKHLEESDCNTVLKCEAANMAIAAEFIVEAAISRKSTLGTHIIKKTKSN